MKKIQKCLICGSPGEDMAVAFFCYNRECQNYRKDIELTDAANRQDENKSDDYTIINWPNYDD